MIDLLLNQPPKISGAARYLEQCCEGQLHREDLEGKGNRIQQLQPDQCQKWGTRRLPDHGQAASHQTSEPA